MYSGKCFFLIVAAVVLLSIDTSFAQSSVQTDSAAKTKHSLVLHLGGGFSNYIGIVRLRPTGLEGSINRTSVTGTIRLMLYPNHRLRIGLESGYTNFYSYNVKDGNTAGRVSLSAIPILIVWSMPIVKRVDVFAGFGTYLLRTQLDYSRQVSSRALVLGSSIALSYTQPVSKRIGIAAEAKWMNAFETRDAALSLQVQMVWKFFQWNPKKQN